MIKIFSAILIIFFPHLSLAELSTIQAPLTPQYFFRLACSQGEIISIANNGNYLWNTITKKLVKIPGDRDPIPLPGEGLVSIPFEINGKIEMRFYLIDELFLKGKKSKPILIDPQLSGWYQSPARLDQQTIRVLTDKNVATYHDYHYSR